MSVLPDIEQQRSDISSASSATGEAYTYNTLNCQYPILSPGHPASRDRDCDRIDTPLRSFLQGAVWSPASKPMLEWTLYRSGRTVTKKFHVPAGDVEKNGSVPKFMFPKEMKKEQEIDCDDSPVVTVRIGTGSGQPSTPFSVTSEGITALFAGCGFSARFLRKLKGKAALFEHLFSHRKITSELRDVPNSSQPPNPNTLELALSSFEVNSLHIFGLHSLPHNTSTFLLFLKTSTFFQPRRVWSWLEESRDILLGTPYLVPNVILAGLQLYVHSFGTWRALVNDMEARIGVTTEVKLLERQGFTKESQDLVMLNNSLSTLKKIIAEHELAAGTMVQQTRAFLRVVELVERLEHAGVKARRRHHRYLEEENESEMPIINEAVEELQGTITRAEIYVQHLQIMQNILQNHTAALYNRINQHDNSLNLAVSQSMKTIAVVTLLYLPPTFVATLFSTSIFDFSSSTTHVSEAWWVLATICVVLTLTTLVMWAVWYKWGRQWTNALLALSQKKEA